MPKIYLNTDENVPHGLTCGFTISRFESMMRECHRLRDNECIKALVIDKDSGMISVILETRVWK